MKCSDYFSFREKHSVKSALIALLFFGCLAPVFSQTTQTFIASGIFTVPANVTTVTVECWGAGGAGGGIPGGGYGGGGGGGGGAYSRSDIIVTPGLNYTVTVGVGGFGNPFDGAIGGDSWFNTISTILAAGGNGGIAANFGNLGAAPRPSGQSIGSIIFTGGGGGNGSIIPGGGGGGGGSSAGRTISGNFGAPGTPGAGGPGGVAPSGGGNGGNGNYPGFGFPGFSPGGGGGGAGNSPSTPGGNGANGQVIITFTAPTISSFTPTSAGSGTTVAITGTNFTGATAVSFGGTPATSFTVVSATSITAVVASGTSGNVVVTIPGATATSPGFTFILPAPTITSFTPTSAAIGATVAITGTNFTGATAVSFGGTAATSFTVVSATSITAVVATGTSGSVFVTTPGGTATLAGFTFIPAPTITTFTPTSAGTGTTVTITGTNFTGVTAVRFGGTAATSFTVVSATSITAVVAAGTTGSVSVTTPGGIATSAGFTFIPAPTITTFTPTSAASGATVTITGTNFTGATAVSFGGTAATSFTVVSATSITAVVAAGATGSVSVTAPGGTATSAGFTFIPAPTISSFTPTSANTGATVTITGTNFTGATAVSFGGTAATSFTVVSATSITAVVASGTTGSVSVTTPGGTATSIGFTFIPAPTITSFTPTSAGTGATVTITGTNFSATPASNTVYFGATKAMVTAATATQLTVTVPTGATYQPITVTVNALTAYSSAPFIVTFPGGGVFDVNSFLAKVDFTTGTNPYNAAIGDVDGDGKSDLVVANVNSNTVSVFRNTSVSGSITASSFASKVDFTTGSGPYDVAVGDVDGDGKPDLVVPNLGSATVSVFRNTSASGSITASSFASKVDFTTGSSPIDAAIGDVDGDGKPDLVVANLGSSTVSVFRNTSTSGSITASSFASKVDFTTGGSPRTTAIGDIDGDGKPDLVVANEGSNTVSVFRNTSASGSITASSFASKVDFTTGVNPYGAAIGDVDGDGKPDLVVTNYSSNTVSVFRNTSAPGSITASSFASKVDFTTGSTPFSAAIGDVDGDGKPDLVVANANSITVSVFRNTSVSGSITASSFASKVDFTTGSNPYSAAIGDVDGDGKPDLVVANYSPNTVSVLRNAIVTPPPTITNFSPTSGPVGTSVTITGTNFSASAANNTLMFNGTSATVTTSTSTSITTSVPSGATTGAITVTVGGQTATSSTNFSVIPAPTITSFIPTSAGSGSTVTITGTNLTGATAVSFGGTAATSFTVVSATSITAVVASGASGNVSVTTAGGTATSPGFTFIPAPTITTFTPTSAASGTTVTLTGTNFTGATAVSFGGTAATSFTVVSATSITAVVASGASGNVSVTTPGGIATMTGFTFIAIPTISSFTPNNGAIGTSVTITGTNFSTITTNNIVYFGATKAIVSIATATQLTVTVPTGATYQPITVTVAGLTAYSNTPFIVTFPGGGLIDVNTFLPKVDFATGASPYGAAIGDFDGDGKPDLVVANNGSGSNTVSVFRNTSASGSITASSFASKVDFTTGTGPYSPAIGDVDGDGKPDLVVANAGSNTVSVFRNTSTSGSITASSFASKVDFTTGTGPFGAAIGDVDGDGKPDLVVANAGSGTVSVFRNTTASGSITSSSFASKVDFTTGTGQYGPAIGDVDGDGRPDLVVANVSQNTVSVFRNTSASGSITASSFASKVDFTTGTNPFGVAIGDVDGDGKPDLVVSNDLSNTVSVFRNTSISGSITAGSFASKVDFTTGSGPFRPAIGDVDGDSKPDLVVANVGSSTVSVFRNTSASGSITTSSFASKVDFTTGTNPYGAAIGDVDGDGKPDLVVVNYGSNTVSVLRNTISVTSAPTITNFNPTSGGVGTPVAITGTNYSATAANNIVMFNGITATVTASTTTSITTSVPSGATTGTITVTVGSLTATSSTSFTVTSASPPTITNFTPTSGPVGTSVTISGTNFAGATAVSFGGTAATSFTVVSATSITAVVASGTTGSVSVTTPGGTATSIGFTFIPAPTITSFTPTSAVSGATVTITGTNLTGATAVSFGGTAATSFTVVSATSITAVVASGTTGSVTVTTPGGTVTSTGFTFIPTPTISSFTPNSGVIGASVTITGTNFSTSAASNIVKFNGTAATITGTPTATSITTSVPTGATTGKITVAIGGLTATSTLDFTVVLITNESFVNTYDRGATLTVSITVNDPSKVSAVNFKSRGISEAASAVKSVKITAVGNKFEKVVVATDLTDPIGLVYSFEVMDQTAGVLNSTTGKAYVKYLASSTDQVLPVLSFGNQVGNYQIIAIPLELTNKSVSSVFASLMPYDKTKWRLFDYANADNREYNTFSVIDAGKGYWLIVKTNTTINPGEGKSVQADDAAPFAINLSTGWNLIGNPYNFRVSWTDVLAANSNPAGVDAKLKVFSGGTLTDGTILEKYRGAFVFSNNAVSIKIPVTRNISLGGRMKKEEMGIVNSLDQNHWEVKLTLKNGPLSNELGGISMHPKATLKGKDPFDEVSVPLPEGLNLFELAYPHPEVFTYFNKDVVPTQDNFRWDFEVKRSTPAGNLELSWKNDYFGDNEKQLFLFDPTTLQITDMRKVNHITLTTATNNLSVLYGGPEYIQHALDSDLPWLGYPYPNPAKEELTIPFRVPERHDQMPVKISIHNGTGVEVATPVNRTLGKGNYDVKWYPQGESGLYLIRMRIGLDETKTMKVIIK